MTHTGTVFRALSSYSTCTFARTLRTTARGDPTTDRLAKERDG